MTILFVSCLDILHPRRHHLHFQLLLLKFHPRSHLSRKPFHRTRKSTIPPPGRLQWQSLKPRLQALSISAIKHHTFSPRKSWPPHPTHTQTRPLTHTLNQFLPPTHLIQPPDPTRHPPPIPKPRPQHLILPIQLHFLNPRTRTQLSKPQPPQQPLTSTPIHPRSHCTRAPAALHRGITGPATWLPASNRQNSLARPRRSCS